MFPPHLPSSPSSWEGNRGEEFNPAGYGMQEPTHSFPETWVSLGPAQGLATARCHEGDAFHGCGGGWKRLQLAIPDTPRLLTLPSSLALFISPVCSDVELFSFLSSQASRYHCSLPRQPAFLLGLSLICCMFPRLLW